MTRLIHCCTPCLCWLDAGCWANGQYRDHLVGQLTMTGQDWLHLRVIMEAQRNRAQRTPRLLVYNNKHHQYCITIIIYVLWTKGTIGIFWKTPNGLFCFKIFKILEPPPPHLTKRIQKISSVFSASNLADSKDSKAFWMFVLDMEEIVIMDLSL